MTEYQELSESELKEVINNAEKALKLRQDSKRKETIAKIKELAASIGVSIEIKDGEKKSSRKGVKVPIKYRNPDDTSLTWSGRGMTPKWLQNLIDSGHDKAEFEV